MTRRAFALGIGSVILAGCGRRAVAPAPPVRGRQVERGLLPAGTTVALRSVVRIESGTAPLAQSFGAVVAGDVIDSSGNPIVGSGAPARLVLRPEGLALSAVMIYGSWHAVEPASGESPAVGGGALLGTLTRGIIETPPFGAQVNQSMEIRTSGSSVQVPAGTLLIFRLDRPARIVNPSVSETRNDTAWQGSDPQS